MHTSLLVLAALSLSGASVVAQTAGSLDPTFNGNGKLVVNLPGRFSGVVVQPDDKIVAVGSEDLPGGNRRWLIQRYHEDGTPDLGFGSGGTVTRFGTSSSDEAFDAALDGLGRVVVVGASPHGAHVDFTAVRLLADGTLDGSFGMAAWHSRTTASSCSRGRRTATRSRSGSGRWRTGSDIRHRRVVGDRRPGRLRWQPAVGGDRRAGPDRDGRVLGDRRAGSGAVPWPVTP